ncbi:MAG: class I SAM-dependent methyltransferase [Spirochaetales bacterium]|nr:class I SAM-dependent methyltransferase [Spirochaetales bacterium]
MFKELTEIFEKPQPYMHANSTELWNNPHISTQMLGFHLDPNNDAASRKKKFLDKSIDWISGKINLNPKSTILDLGCGPGLYANEYAKRGAKVAGIDVSTNSIAYANKKAKEDKLDIEYINDNYVTRDFRKKYDLITIIHCDYCVLNPDERRVLLEKIAKALEEDGLFIFDVHSDDHFENVREKRSCHYSDSGGFWSPEAHFVFENIFKYSDERIILEKHTVIESMKKFTIHNYIKCFEIDEIKKELADNGFHAMEDYSDISGTAYKRHAKDIALVAKRMK